MLVLASGDRRFAEVRGPLSGLYEFEPYAWKGEEDARWLKRSC